MWIYAIIAWMLTIGIYVYIVRSDIQTDWGSALHGLRFQVAIRSLLSIDMQQHLDENWKPQLLMLYTLSDGDAEISASEESPNQKGGHTHELMFSVAQQLRHGSGLILAAAIIPCGADDDEVELLQKAEAERKEMIRMMDQMDVGGFPLTVVTHDESEGKAYAMQCAGLGPLTPNTVVMGWPWWWQSNPTKFVPAFINTVQQATTLRKAVLLCHNIKDFPTNDELQEGYIDVWWIKHDGGLLLLISHLLQKHRVWKKCRLRLHLITEVGTNTTLLQERMHKLLNKINIAASVEEVITVDSESLLPYMESSVMRARNEEFRLNEEKLVNHGHHETAEELLEKTTVGGSTQADTSFSKPTVGVTKSKSNLTDATRAGLARRSRRLSGTPDAFDKAAKLHQPMATTVELAHSAIEIDPAVVSSTSEVTASVRASPPPSPPEPAAAGPPPGAEGLRRPSLSADLTKLIKSKVQSSPGKQSAKNESASNKSDDDVKIDKIPGGLALSEFIKKNGLTGEAAQELQAIFSMSVTKAKEDIATYNWDQFHEVILQRSAGSSLVIINLPDPPEGLRIRMREGGRSKEDSEAEMLQEGIEYMNYMEGLAANLPRVMYVHGAGQEVIDFQHAM